MFISLFVWNFRKSASDKNSKPDSCTFFQTLLVLHYGLSWTPIIGHLKETHRKVWRVTLQFCSEKQWRKYELDGKSKQKQAHQKWSASKDERKMAEERKYYTEEQVKYAAVLKYLVRLMKFYFWLFHVLKIAIWNFCFWIYNEINITHLAIYSRHMSFKRHHRIVFYLIFVKWLIFI